MNLNEIIQAAQGGQGIDNLASRFGLSPEQTQAAIQAVLPAFSKGLQGAAQDPNGLGGLLSHLTSGAHSASYADPDQASAATGAGGQVLGQIFGSPGVTARISQQASRVTGVDPSVIDQMMPVVASMLMGGLTHAMNGQGLGGVLGQLAGAANSGGFAPSTNAPAQAPASGGGWLGSLVGSVVGALEGGGSSAPQSADILAGLNTLTGMMHSGVQVPQAHQQALDDIMQPDDQAPPN